MSTFYASKWIYRSLFFAFLALGVYLSCSDSSPEVVIQKDGNFHAENEGKLVFVSGLPSFKGKTTDSDFGISIAAPVLKRNVSKSRQYDGMGFPYDVRGMRFVSDITLGGTLKLDSKFTELLLLDSTRAETNSCAVFSKTWNNNWKNVGKLPEQSVPKGLVYKRNAYSAPEGEPKFEISYQGYLLPKDIGIFCAFGLQKNGKLMLESQYSRFYDMPVDPRRIKRTLRQKARYPFLGVMLFALPFLVLGWRKEYDS